MKRGAAKLVEGFRLAGESGDVAMSFAASFAVRPSFSLGLRLSQWLC